MKIFRWIWLAFTLCLLGYAFYQGMYVAPTEATMGDIQRIFYYHFPSAMMTFLYPVVKHLSLAARRKRQRMTGDDAALESAAASESGPAAEAARAELSAVLACLPLTHREVLLLRFVDGFSLEEIATAMKIPLGTVKSRIHNALATLRADPRTRGYFEP